jgi:hypothetical protein
VIVTDTLRPPIEDPTLGEPLAPPSPDAPPLAASPEEADFRPSKHRFITHQQARAIDSAIDQFNDIIADAVRHARREGRDWRVLGLCSVLDGLSFRRFVNDPVAAERNGWSASTFSTYC